MSQNKEYKYLKDDSFLLIQGWMITQLNLKGLELMIYACIYGFSHSKCGKFTGSLRYLCEITNATKIGVTKALNLLIEKGLIYKEEKYINSLKYCEYTTNK